MFPEKKSKYITVVLEPDNTQIQISLDIFRQTQKCEQWVEKVLKCHLNILNSHFEFKYESDECPRFNRFKGGGRGVFCNVIVIRMSH